MKRRKYIVDMTQCAPEHNPARLAEIPMIDGIHECRFDIVEEEMPGEVVKKLRALSMKHGYGCEALKRPMGTDGIAPGAQVRDAETGEIVYRRSKKWRWL